MSGLMNAIGQGISAAGYAAGDMFARQALLENQSDVELERQKRLAEFKAGLESKIANQQREEMTQRVDQKAGELADAQLQNTRGLIDSGVYDRRPDRTDDMNRSYDQQRTTLKSKLRTQAAIETGDITPKDAASVEYKNEALVYKAMLENLKEQGRNDREDMKEQGRQERSDARIGAMLDAIDRRAAARDNKASDKDSARVMLGIVENQRKDLSSEANQARQLYQDELKAALGPAAKKTVQDKWQKTFDDIETRRKAADSDYDFLRTKVGMPSRATTAPAPAPRSAPAAPAPTQQRPPLSSFQR